MKITLANGTVLEMNDAPAPKPEAKDAPATPTTTAPAKPRQADAVLPKPPAVKAAQPTREAVPPPPSAQTQPPTSDKETSQPASNPLHSFDLQGAVNDILDPSRGNPNVYQFVQPKGDV